MHMLEQLRRAGLVPVLLLALVTSASALAQEPAVIRLSDAVGDTIDLAGRDSFRLFPNTAGFRQAVILELPESEIVAEVMIAGGDSSRHVFYRLAPNQLERIRYLVDNRDLVAAQHESDSTAERALAAFWQEIEDHPLQTNAGKPAEVNDLTQAQPEANVAGGTPSRPVTRYENRLTCAAHGAAAGSVVGGCIGAYAGYTLVTPGHLEETECCEVYVPPLYSVDLPVVLATSIGATAAASVAGYAIGVSQDRKSLPVRFEHEVNEWRTGCAAASLLPAIGLGILAGAAARGTIFGRERDGYHLENDPEGWSALPAVLTGICVSVEVVTLSYHIGRTMDRRKAEEAEARRRALGR
jgi:hypothetical protein